ncbi:DUF2955 domain-containing protein [Shewanella avicenniae]|uniref:DUF2955 domain-containing protein n=1 Tax=Shewanella avicenniae TaxID=2814294 RepID=A0ABX7QQE2_9GAMM|nr:DUF2955 domain-containing protein [Shewanella avicenniae]QSX33146.1 DUF2955 domain-containing protein [Shewanella avicenniae]
MFLPHMSLTANDLRQCLRIATGATLGFALCKVMGWDNGVFFVVTPMLLLGLVPVMNAHAARQMIASSVLCALEVGLVGGMLGSHPVAMTLFAFVLFLHRFACMSKGPLFLYGASGVINLSIMLHFASYSTVDVNDLITLNLMSAFVAVGIAYLMKWLIPDVEQRPAFKPEGKQPHRRRHEAILGATMATMSFVVFQMFDLQDSLSAQATTLLLLFPMHWNGALGYARKRAYGTIVGVGMGLMIQILLYDWAEILLFLLPLFWICVMLCAQIHVKERSGSGIGFGSMTTLGILFGQYLSPNSDMVFSAMYRISSILGSIVATLVVLYLIHRLLNRFEMTRFGT